MYVFIFLFAFGLIFFKDFRIGIFTLIPSAIVFSIVILIGIVYNVFYPTVMAFKEKDYKVFFRIYWRLIEGTYSFIGSIFYKGFAIRYDELGNVWGEWIEDFVTSYEGTLFGDKMTTISASIGHLEHKKLPLKKVGKDLSKLLNFVFSENKHAEGSYLLKLEHKRIEDMNLLEKKK